MDDVRLKPCEHCQSEGRIIRIGFLRCLDEPVDIDCGPCPVCEGTGGALIEVEPIDLDDLCRYGGCQYAKSVSMPEYSCVGECQYRSAPPPTTQEDET